MILNSTGIIENRTLAKLRYVVSQTLSKDISDAYAEEISDHVTGTLVYQIRANVWAEKLSGELVKYPQDWKEAFKERWFPEWLLEKYPIKYKIVSYNFLVKYPKFKPLNSTCGDHVVIAQIQGSPFIERQ